MATSAQFFKKCLISGAEDLYNLPGYEKYFLVKSKSSGFVFCSKIASPQELTDHYQGYDREHYLSSITIKRFNELLDTFEPYKKTNRILDVGCGSGFLMEQAKKRGWEVYGTEYTPDAIEICESKGINMKQGKLDPTWFEPESFDVITSIEVLEHINNPVEEVTNINYFLRKGGLLYFTTPNFNAVERFLLKAEYDVIQYPEHLCYYTPATINYLLKNNNFKKKKLLTTGFSFTRMKTSTGQSTEKVISESSSDEVIRGKIEKNIFLRAGKLVINNLLSFFGVGNSIKGWYIKA
ncbi:class I SAM-dependent methyltransferase [Mucilaginibacter sp. AW1-3]